MKHFHSDQASIPIICVRVNTANVASESANEAYSREARTDFATTRARLSSGQVEAGNSKQAFTGRASQVNKQRTKQAFAVEKQTGAVISKGHMFTRI